MMTPPVGFVLATYLFDQLGLGDSGLVYVNVLNLFLRVVYSWAFAKGYFGKERISFDLGVVSPLRGVAGAFAWSYLVTR